MPHFARRARITTFPVLAAAAIFLCAYTLRANDPPATAPSSPFHRSLVGSAFRDRLNDVLAELGNLDDLAASALPPAGSRIFNVNEGGPGAQLGIRDGDVIAEVDGQPLLQHALNSVRTSQNQTLTLVNPAGKSRTVEIKPGLIGINAVRYFRPELLYLRSAQRDPKWDRYAVVGAAASFTNPKLAETAWAAAFEAGYPGDAVSEYCGALIAWRQGRNDDALQFNDSLLARKNVPLVIENEMLDYALAIANNRPKQAIDVIRPMASLHDLNVTSRHLAGLLDALAAADKPTAPSDAITSRGVSTLLTSMQPALEDAGKSPRDAYRRHVHDWFANDRRPLEFAANTDHFNVIVQMPTVDAPDVEYVVRGTMQACDDDHANFGKVLVAGLVDCDNPNRIGRSPRFGCFATATIFTEGRLEIAQTEHDTEIQARNVSDDIGNAKPFTLRLLHANGYDEIWLNDCRMLLLPSVARPKRVGFKFGVVGVRATIEVAYSRINHEPKPPAP